MGQTRKLVMIVGIGVVGPENSPLYIKSWGSEAESDPLKFHRIIHIALDVIDEKVKAKRAPVDARLGELYIGFLYPTEEYKTYGYQTQTNVKYVLVLSDTSANDQNINGFFKRFHDLWVRAVSNPFYELGGPMQSKRFEQSVEELVKRCSSK